MVRMLCDQKKTKRFIIILNYIWKFSVDVKCRFYHQTLIETLKTSFV